MSMAGSQPVFARLDDYIRQRQAQYGGDIWNGKVYGDMQTRWGDRVQPNRWHLMGEKGAEEYLKKYGRGIKAPKCIHLALWAEKEGWPEIARGFWVRAMQLEGVQISPAAAASAPKKADPVKAFFGADEEDESPHAAPAAKPAPRRAPTPEFETIRYLPDHLQPVKLSVMKPVKSPLKVQALIESDEFVAIPDRQVQRVILGQGQGWEFIKGEKGENLGAIPDELLGALNAARIVHGEIIIEGELFYRDAQGGIHPTRAAAEAVKAPADVGFTVMRALVTKKGDLTGAQESERLETGAKVARVLANFDPERFGMPELAKTKDEKAALAAKGKTIWLRTSSTYNDPAGYYRT